MASKKGVLYWSNNLRFDRVSEFALFDRSPFRLQCRGGYLMAYSSFEDVMVLKVHRQNESKKHKLGEDLVTIEKDEILAFFEKVK